MRPLLEATDFSVEYPGSSGRALQGINFSIQAGEVVGLLGESGSGKSTLAWSILNLLPPGARVSGRVCFDGQDLLKLSEKQFRRLRGRDLALVSQEPGSALHPMMGIGTQIEEVLRAHRCDLVKDAAGLALSQVALPPDERILRARPHQLSGGQRQRAALAQALSCKPRLLIADEPTSALDSSTQAEVLDLFLNLKRQRELAILLITHNPAVLAELADRILVMSDGCIVESGDPVAVYGQAQHPFTKRMLAVLHSLNQVTASAEPGHPSEPPLVSARGLRKTYTQRSGLWARLAPVVALDGVDLDIRTGYSIALVGRSGSGKSTLGRCLAGLERPDSGELHASSEPGQIQYIFQDSTAAMNPRFTVRQIIDEPLLISGERDPQVLKERSRRLLDLTELPADLLVRRPAEVSGGQRQRVAIARALNANPRALILDECLSGLDLPTQAQIVELLKSLQRTLGLTYIYILHDLQLARQVADEIAVMDAGRVVDQGPSHRLYSKPAHAHTRALIAAMLPRMSRQ